MNFLMFGLNHLSAPVQVREKLAGLCDKPLPGVDGNTLEGATILTCNRVEAYFSGNTQDAEASFNTWLKSGGISVDENRVYLKKREDIEVVKHLFRVTSGLDSMILGESQILGQVKEAYRANAAKGLVGKYLHGLFQKALEVGKRVRRETKISKNTVSIASTAVELANRIFGPLENCLAVVVGAGEMASIVARQLFSRKIGGMIFVNRTLSRAEELAIKFKGKAFPLDKLPELLIEADLLISSTGAPHPILGPADFELAMSKRPFRPLFAIDIAVPRDIAPGCDHIENLFVYNIDDLQNVVTENIQFRRLEAEKAEMIVLMETEDFKTFLSATSVGPLIRKLKEKMEKTRKLEVEKFLKQKIDNPQKFAEILEHCTKSLVAKILHQPIVFLKEKSLVRGTELQDWLKMFGLD